jgi:uncharacterized protein (TIGR00369 family)
MSNPGRAHQEAFGVRIPFVEHLGFEMAFFDDGRSELHFAPKAEHLNSFEVVHGGAIMTLLDVSMATAARSVDKASGVVTIEMKTSFMRPAQGPLVAKGRLIHRTKTMAFTETSLFDQQGSLCAHAANPAQVYRPIEGIFHAHQPTNSAR